MFAVSNHLSGWSNLRSTFGIVPEFLLKLCPLGVNVHSWLSSGLMQTCYINNRLPEPVRSSEDTSSLNLCPVFSWTDVDVRAAPDKLFQAH